MAKKKEVEKVEKAAPKKKSEAVKPEVVEAKPVKKQAPPRPPKLTPVPTPDEIVPKYGVKHLYEGKSGSAFIASLNAPAADDIFPRLTIYEVKNNCMSERVIDVPDISVYKTTELTETEVMDRLLGNGDSNG